MALIATAAFAMASSALASNSVLHPRDVPILPPCSYPFTDFVYSGCFIDSQPILGLTFDPLLNGNLVTPELCIAACKANGYKYAGEWS